MKIDYRRSLFGIDWQALADVIYDAGLGQANPERRWPTTTERGGM